MQARTMLNTSHYPKKKKIEYPISYYCNYRIIKYMYIKKFNCIE